MKMPDNDAAYYRMREQQERELAEAARDESSREIHRVLADKYRSLAKLADSKRRDPPS